MKYITQIELENFQSHKYTCITLDRGLNVIVGNSDAGKTAILRAIKWALYNEPSGDYFIRQGEKKVSVTVTFNTGAIVRRMRSSSKNMYYLKNPKGEEFNFEGFGNTVPQEIVDCVGMYKIYLDNDSTSILNIAEQLDGPFLLNERPSLRASAIGRLIGVNYIDDALRAVVKDNKKISHDLRYLRNQEDELKNKIQSYEYLVDLENQYAQLVNIREEISGKEEKKRKYALLSEQWNSLNFNLNEAKKSLSLFAKLNHIEIDIANLEIKNQRFQKFQQLNMEYLTNREGLEELQTQISNLHDLDSLNELLTVLSEKILYEKRYENLATNIHALFSELDVVNTNLKNTENTDEIHSILNAIQDKLLQINYYQKLWERLQTNAESLNKGYAYMKRFEFLGETESYMERIVSQFTKWQQNLKILQQYKQIQKEIITETNKVDLLREKMEEKMKSYETLIMETGVCPFCFSEITPESLEHIKFHLQGE